MNSRDVPVMNKYIYYQRYLLKGNHDITFYNACFLPVVTSSVLTRLMVYEFLKDGVLFATFMLFFAPVEFTCV